MSEKDDPLSKTKNALKDLCGTEKEVAVDKFEQKLRERLAELEHDQWLSWIQSVTRHGIHWEKWMESMKPYSELTEEQKDKDREWADKVLKIVAEREKQWQLQHHIDHEAFKNLEKREAKRNKKLQQIQQILKKEMPWQAEIPCRKIEKILEELLV